MNGQTREIVRRLEALIAHRSAALLQTPGDNPTPRTNSQTIVATGWDAIDRALAPSSPRYDTDALAKLARGGLARGVIHEWLGSGGSEEGKRASRGRWLPPHTLLIHLAWRAIDSDSTGLIVWIGRRVWPHACALARFTTEITEITERDFDFGRRRLAWVSPNLKFPSSVPSVFSVVNLASRSIFLDLPDDASRLWAIDLALRNPAVNVVIADGSRFRMAKSRRLQLAAERGHALALLARPAWEAGELSAAATCWRVRRTPSPSLAPRWIVELLRCKHGSGRMQTSLTSTNGEGDWEIEYAAPGHLRLVADVVDRSDPKATAGGTTLSHWERAG